jgi:hypothetical protein
VHGFSFQHGIISLGLSFLFSVLQPPGASSPLRSRQGLLSPAAAGPRRRLLSLLSPASAAGTQPTTAPLPHLPCAGRRSPAADHRVPYSPAHAHLPCTAVGPSQPPLAPAERASLPQAAAAAPASARALVPRRSAQASLPSLRAVAARPVRADAVRRDQDARTPPRRSPAPPRRPPSAPTPAPCADCTFPPPGTRLRPDVRAAPRRCSAAPPSLITARTPPPSRPRPSLLRHRPDGRGQRRHHCGHAGRHGHHQPRDAPLYCPC